MKLNFDILKNGGPHTRLGPAAHANVITIIYSRVLAIVTFPTIVSYSAVEIGLYLFFRQNVIA